MVLLFTKYQILMFWVGFFGCFWLVGLCLCSFIINIIFLLKCYWQIVENWRSDLGYKCFVGKLISRSTSLCIINHSSLSVLILSPLSNRIEYSLLKMSLLVCDLLICLVCLLSPESPRNLERWKAKTVKRFLWNTQQLDFMRRECF